MMYPSNPMDYPLRHHSLPPAPLHIRPPETSLYTYFYHHSIFITVHFTESAHRSPHCQPHPHRLLRVSMCRYLQQCSQHIAFHSIHIPCLQWFIIGSSSISPPHHLYCIPLLSHLRTIRSHFHPYYSIHSH